MSEQSSATWLGEGEKYALLGLNIKSDPAGFADEQISHEFAALTQTAFKMPSHWREWLGTIRAEEVEDCDLFILAKLKSKQPSVLDQENKTLEARVGSFYRGLLLIILSRDGRTLTVRIPVAFHQSKGRKQVVTPPGTASWAPRPARVDDTLVKAIVRAFRWRDMLESGRHATIRDLAKAEAINESYLGRVMRLTLLSPAIVVAILDGNHPPSLELDDLVSPFPVEWNKQRWD